MAAEDDEHRGDAERGDAQVRDRVRGGRLGGPEEVDEGRGGRQDHRDDGGAQEQRQPDAVHALADGGGELARADTAGDGAGGGVGEEDEDADRGGQQGGGDGESGELRGAQVADDRAVRHHEEGFGDEGSEGGYGEGDDLAVVLTAMVLGLRSCLGHGAQCNHPQVIDAMLLGSLRVARLRVGGQRFGDDLARVGEVFLLHSQRTAKRQVSARMSEPLRGCSQRCPRRRAQVSASSPQHWVDHPQGLWITRLADGADGPTVVRRPTRVRPGFRLRNLATPTRQKRGWASRFVSVGPYGSAHGEVRSADGWRRHGEYLRALGRPVGGGRRTR